MWCLIGCSIGDFGTIYYFQIIDHSLSIYGDVARNSKWFDYKHYIRNHNSNENIFFAEAISIAFKMSFISMISMEIAMNATDLIFAGGVLTITIIPFMLLAVLLPRFHIIITDSKNITVMSLK